MPEKIRLAKMLTCASPPWMWPTRALAMAMIRSVSLQAFISSPARKKNGIARMRNELIDAVIRCVSRARLMSVTKK